MEQIEIPSNLNELSRDDLVVLSLKIDGTWAVGRGKWSADNEREFAPCSHRQRPARSPSSPAFNSLCALLLPVAGCAPSTVTSRLSLSTQIYKANFGPFGICACFCRLRHKGSIVDLLVRKADTGVLVTALAGAVTPVALAKPSA